MKTTQGPSASREYTHTEIDKLLAENPENPFIQGIFGPSILDAVAPLTEIESAPNVVAKRKEQYERLRLAVTELVGAVMTYREAEPAVDVTSWHFKHFAVYLEGRSLRIAVFHDIP